jgi:alkylation response protein AidB-like acyl-CoA dehydrogenase
MSDPELQTFRAEVRAWLEANAPPEIRQPHAETCFAGRRWPYSADQRLWLDRMSARGWTTPTWPREYGGAELSPQQAHVLDQELARLGARKPVENQGVWMLGPALLEYGDEEQKRRHLPPISSGELRWCQGYSEPGAGSDLASLQCRGVQDGDDLIITGSKIWTSHADQCDWIFALVRTEPDAPQHSGISFVLIDMSLPGVSTRPIRLLNGERHFCQTFFDEVRVPLTNVVGGRGRGWSVAKYLLQHERSQIGGAGGASRALGNETLVQYARRLLGDEALAADPRLRQDIIDEQIDSWALEIWMERTRDLAVARQLSSTASSGLKVFGTELAKRRSEIVLAVAGDDGLEAGARASHAWLGWPMSTVGGGTTEIQLNIIAKRELGLPQG